MRALIYSKVHKYLDTGAIVREAAFWTERSPVWFPGPAGWCMGGGGGGGGWMNITCDRKIDFISNPLGGIKRENCISVQIPNAIPVLDTESGFCWSTDRSELRSTAISKNQGPCWMSHQGPCSLEGQCQSPALVALLIKWLACQRADCCSYWKWA